MWNIMKNIYGNNIVRQGRTPYFPVFFRWVAPIAISPMSLQDMH